MGVLTHELHPESYAAHHKSHLRSNLTPVNLILSDAFKQGLHSSAAFPYTTCSAILPTLHYRVPSSLKAIGSSRCSK
jgi:hypothetical protein